MHSMWGVPLPLALPADRIVRLSTLCHVDYAQLAVVYQSRRLLLQALYPHDDVAAPTRPAYRPSAIDVALPAVQHDPSSDCVRDCATPVTGTACPGSCGDVDNANDNEAARGAAAGGAAAGAGAQPGHALSMICVDDAAHVLFLLVPDAVGSEVTSLALVLDARGFARAWRLSPCTHLYQRVLLCTDDSEGDDNDDAAVSPGTVPDAAVPLPGLAGACPALAAADGPRVVYTTNTTDRDEVLLLQASVARLGHVTLRLLARLPLHSAPTSLSLTARVAVAAEDRHLGIADVASSSPPLALRRVLLPVLANAQPDEWRDLLPVTSTTFLAVAQSSRIYMFSVDFPAAAEPASLAVKCCHLAVPTGLSSFAVMREAPDRSVRPGLSSSRSKRSDTAATRDLATPPASFAVLLAAAPPHSLLQMPLRTALSDISLGKHATSLLSPEKPVLGTDLASLAVTVARGVFADFPVTGVAGVSPDLVFAYSADAVQMYVG